jgi:hypothetical protein
MKSFHSYLYAKQIDQIMVMNPSRTQIIYEVLGNWVRQRTWSGRLFWFAWMQHASAVLTFLATPFIHWTRTFEIRSGQKEKQVAAWREIKMPLHLSFFARRRAQKAADAAQEICICAASTRSLSFALQTMGER